MQINNDWKFLYWIIDFMLKVESLSDYTYLFFLNEYEKNGKIIIERIQ